MTREEMNEEKQNEIFREQNKENVKKGIKIFIKATIIFLILSFLFFTYTTYISTTKIGVREYRITNNKIPETFNGLKIIQMSDLHYGSTMLIEDVKKIKILSNERKPDLVVFTGDLLNKKLNAKEQEELIKELKEIDASLGKYAVLGDEDKEDVITIFNQSDFTVLRNEYDLIYKDNMDSILLIGLSSSISKEQDIEKGYQYFQQEQHNSEIYTITLLHEPDRVDDIISTHPTNLFLAGHSHNGNIRVPILHYPLVKVKEAEKYHQDFYSIQNAQLYISSGLGTETGIRLFCRPSINFFRLSKN